jgi:carbon starvation protein
MMLLVIFLACVAALLLGGRLYSRVLARVLGEDPCRPTPAVRFDDGRDFVPTPTPIVFAHHFASIAGAGPIVGPLLAMCFGWLPALIWIVAGGVLIGGVHDYCATLIAMREGGRSLAVVTRRALGRPAFLMFTFLIIAMLGLVTAVFLQISAQALTNVASAAELSLTPGQHALARHEFVENGQTQIRIGGIASTSVIVITVCAPLIGWLYIRRGVNPWICSVLAVLICCVSVALGIRLPVRADTNVWMWGIAAYTLLAAGLPVWLFLQSRDFINVHLLYAGLALMFASVVGAGLRGVPVNFQAATIADGAARTGGWLWPALFITIACGACSGFHSLCAGGTTCKQLRTETAARRVGYWAMLLESFLAVCVVCAVIIGLTPGRYLDICYPVGGKGNVNLGFALAMGNASNLGTGLSAAWGTIFGMLLLEGFVVTTLDTAVRLNRYLFEEAWASLFACYDVFVEAAARFAPGTPPAAGSGGIPPDSSAMEYPAGDLAPRMVLATHGLKRAVLTLLRLPWFNTFLAVALMLWMASQGGILTIWQLFASGNQLLAGFGLAIASIWLLQRRRPTPYTLVPAVFMLVTTLTMLVKLLFQKYLPNASTMTALLVTDLALLALSAGLLYHVARTLVRCWTAPQRRAAGAAAEAC